MFKTISVLLRARTLLHNLLSSGRPLGTQLVEWLCKVGQLYTTCS